ncbi:SLC13 family permease [Leuconostoc palmae]|uniref:SLC13 family permease n=1 Tax=Leuconostoc palmae TaxID=501487 RepID=UPI001C7D9B3D|nr:SLC13 family permease [Leuconostoc palmae]
MVNVSKKIFSDKTFLMTLILAIFAVYFGKVLPSDIDQKTIIALLSLIVIVTVYEKLNILKFIANTIVDRCRSTRSILTVMLLFSFFGSMLFTNDVAILTLVPIFFKISQKVDLKRIIPISLLTIYANLGSAIMPFGNPQNLYLASFYHLSLYQFMGMSLPIGIIALISLLIVSFVFPKKDISDLSLESIAINKQKTIILVGATIIVILGILSFIPIWCSLIASILSAFLLDKKVFKDVDYGIILTFINFFLIVGAISRVDMVHKLLVSTTHTTINTLFSGILSSQFISNVPAAILLSKFTSEYYGLYLGVTIGGLGTIIASLANLLALRQYNIYDTRKSSFNFFVKFTGLNIVYLAIFIIIGIIIIL